MPHSAENPPAHGIHTLARLLDELRDLDTWPDTDLNAWYLSRDFLAAIGGSPDMIAAALGPPPARDTDTVTPTARQRAAPAS